MLVNQIAAIRDSVVLVLRIVPTSGGAVSILPAGTASYLGNDIFLTASHLFADPPVTPAEKIRVATIPGNGFVATIYSHDVTIDHEAANEDLTLLRAPGFGSTLPDLRVSVAGEPDGRSVFSYGFISPKVAFTPQGPMLIAVSRACASIIGARVPFIGNKYELDGQTYPGESGAPVLRVSDHVVVGVVQASRLIQVPQPHASVRGPTLAGPLDSIAGELANRGIHAIA